MASLPTVLPTGECSLPDQKQRVIITCEHATNHIPPEYAHHISDPDTLASHRAFDPGTQDLARLLARRLQAPCFEADISRLLVDCNRSPGHNKLFHPSLNKAEREAIFTRHYQPFRRSALDAITATINNGSTVLHLSIHSFTPRLNGEIRRADIGLLYDPRRSKEKLLCGRWLANLKKTAPTLRLRRNYPYRGIADGFATALRKMFVQENYLGIELEVNQNLTSDNESDWQALQETIITSLTATLAQEEQK